MFTFYDTYIYIYVLATYKMINRKINFNSKMRDLPNYLPK